MVQILPKFDPGGDVGRSIGGGFGEALKMLTDRKLSQDALGKLKTMDTSNMSPSQIFAEVGQATAGLPHLQKQAGDMTQLLINQKQAQAQVESGKRRAEQLESEKMRESGKGPAGAPAATEREGDGTPGMRDVPELRDQPGDKHLLTPEESFNVMEPFLATGDAKGAEQARARAQSDKLKSFELKQQETEALRREQDVKRALESDLAQNVQNRTADLLEQKGVKGTPEQWKRLSYNYFQEERDKPQNRDKSDEKIWGEASKRIERKVEDLSQAADKHYRPTWRMNKDRRAEGARNWAQNHLEKYGNTQEDRSLLKSILTDNEWSAEEATAIVQPLNKKLENQFSAIPKAPPPLRAMSANQAAIQGPKREEKVQKYLEKIVPKLVKDFGPDDSLFLLKSRLVRDKNLTDDQAVGVINKMQEKIELTEEQIGDLGLIQENTRPSIYDVFSGDRPLEILGPLIK